MNVLFTCAGRRNYLLSYFKEAIGNEGLIVATDSQYDAPALRKADVPLIVPKVNHPSYIKILCGIIEEFEIKAIIPLNDLELKLLAAAKTTFKHLGAQLILADEHYVATCADKWATYKYFLKAGLNSPKTYLDLPTTMEALKNKTISFPLIVKPRYGSASFGVEAVYDIEELQLTSGLLCKRLKRSYLSGFTPSISEHSIVIQEKINGQEYGMDILNTLQGEFFGSYVRLKAAMRAGETDKATTVFKKEFHSLGKKLGQLSRHPGIVDCDFIQSEKNGKNYLIEINPRFGGGYPISHAAGLDVPRIYAGWLFGRNDVLKYDKYKQGLKFSKYENLIAIPQNHDIETPNKLEIIKN